MNKLKKSDAHKILLATSGSNVKKFSTAIALELHNKGKATIRAIGQPAFAQTLKAIASVQHFNFFEKTDVMTKISWVSVPDKRDESKNTERYGINRI